MIRLFLCALILTAMLPAGAQTVATFTGKITDKSGTPLGGISVHVLNTNLGANTDADGNFAIAGLAEGTYMLQVSGVGYASIERTVSMSGGGNATAVFQLSESMTQLDDIVVTAQKKEELLQSIPASISSISATQVEDYRIWNSKDITAIVPNLYSANPGDGRNVTSIRGITSTSYDPAVATYIDGVNQFGLDTYIAQLFDVERIEVLRGPQGTLYGRNAMGGVINIITKQPTNTTKGFAEVNVGNYGQQRYTAAVRTPLIKNKLFLGVAGIYDNNGGFYTNQFTGSRFDKRHSFTGNYYLKYLASPKWTFTFNLKHNQNRNNGAFPLAYQGVALTTPFQLNQDAVAQMVDNIFNTSLSASYAGNHFNFSSQSAYQSNYRYYKTPIDGDFSPIDAVTIVNNYGRKYNNVKVLTQEFKLTSPGSSSSHVNWTLGTYLFYQNSPVKQATHYGKDGPMIGAPDSLSSISTSTGKRFGTAFFGQATWSATERLSVTGGIRYDYEYTRQTVLGEAQKDGDPGPPAITQPETTAHAIFHAVSPKMSVAYLISENSTLYATYSRGYRTGGLSQGSLYPYKPEYSNNFEAGLKNSFFQNRLRANFSLFYIRVTNSQIPQLILPEAITITSNVGQLTSKGAELELSTRVAKGLQLDVNLGFNDARYKTIKLPLPDSLLPVQSGKKQVFTSPVTSMVALQYTCVLDQHSGFKFVVRGESMYLGKKYFAYYYNAPPLAQNGYGLLNVRGGVSLKGLEIMFWMRNLSNKKYIDYGYDFGAVHLGNPRNYGVTIRKSF